MGNNFHIPYTANTLFKVAHMTVPFTELDRAITYLKNVIVSCDGTVTYNKSTGVLTWTDSIRIKFYTADGALVENTIAAGNVTLSGGQAAYITLNETNASALTVSTGTSGFLAYNVLVLAYRNATSNNLYPVYLHIDDPGKIVQAKTCADTVTIDWSKGSTAEITLDRATTTFSFTGAYHGQRLVLICRQDGTGSRTINFDAGVRSGIDLIAPPTLTSTMNKKDYLGFIYNNTDTKYDFVSLTKGF